jgi:hypothetical protein
MVRLLSSKTYLARIPNGEFHLGFGHYVSDDRKNRNSIFTILQMSKILKCSKEKI